MTEWQEDRHGRFSASKDGFAYRTSRAAYYNRPDDYEIERDRAVACGVTGEFPPFEQAREICIKFMGEHN